MKTLVRNGTVLSFADDPVLIEQGYVAIDEEGRIAEVSGGDPPTARTVVDARGGLILPGLINAHMHSYSTFARGMDPGGEPPQNFQQVLEGLWWKMDKTLTLEDCYYSGLISAMDAARRGTTTLIDHHASPGAVEGSVDALRRGFEAVGIRGVFCYEVSDRDGESVRDRGFEENLRALEQYEGDSRHAALLGLHASFTLGEESLRRAGKVVEDWDTGVHIHVAEGRNDEPHARENYGMSVVERLGNHGLLTPKTLLAHCIHVSDEEIQQIADAGAGVVHNPTSNMNNAVGAAPVLKMLDEGVTVGLGTDGMSPDPWTDLRCVSYLQNHARENPSASFSEGVKMLTQNNPELARRCFGTPVGRLRVGEAGDVITLDYDPPTPLRDDNIAAHLLYGLRAGQVRNTVVNGELILENRRLSGVDVPGACHESRRRARAVWKRLAGD